MSSRPFAKSVLTIGNRFLSASIVRPGGPGVTVSAKAPFALTAVTGPTGRVSDAGCPSPTTRPPVVDRSTDTV